MTYNPDGVAASLYGRDDEGGERGKTPSKMAASFDEEIALDLATLLRSASRSGVPVDATLATKHAAWLEEIAERARVYRSFPLDVAAEIERAISKFPTWPTDPLHALAVLGEEYGELTKAVLQQVYEPHKNPTDAVRKEAVQVAAMALRFLVSLEAYQYQACPQHRQGSASNPELARPPAPGGSAPSASMDANDRPERKPNV